MELHEIQPFIDSTRHVFRTLFLMEVDPIGDGLTGRDGPVVRSSIGIDGDIEGAVGLVLPLETARRLNTMLTGAPGGGDTADVCDAAAELTDVIAANGAARLLGRKARLTCATASLRAVAPAFEGTDTPAERVAFASECGPFELELRVSCPALEGGQCR